MSKKNLPMDSLLARYFAEMHDVIDHIPDHLKAVHTTTGEVVMDEKRQKALVAYIEAETKRRMGE
jgi:hypothetical protein